ncbi:tail fiber protein [Abyssisolibacter fermentans]|uniref:tail fiber protein n=1 Tax=Abyssisolibacter fermentans TaxID=1766203 RepID=UPI0008301D33|nr:tail fiber protein [Abyssisolibacter fermentans]
MEYNSKTNWQREDIVTEKDLNRIEQGIEDVCGKLGGIKEGAEVNRPISDSVTLDDSTTSASSKAVKIAYDKASEKVNKIDENATKIGNLETNVDGIVNEKRQPNGIASLDENAQVPTEQLNNVQYLKDFYGRSVKKVGFETFIEVYDIFSKYVNNNLDSSTVGSVSQSTGLRLTSNGGSIGSIKEFANYIELSRNTTVGGACVVIKDTAFDLTNATSVEIDFEIIDPFNAMYAEFGLIKDKNNNNTYTCGYPDGFLYNRGPNSTIRQTHAFDVSNVTGNYYFKMSIWGNETYNKSIRIYSIKIDNNMLYPNQLNYDFNNASVSLKTSTLSTSLPMPLLQIPSHFLDWYSINAMVNTPNGTNIKFDIYDNYGNLLKEDVKQGEILKLTNPIIQPRVTLSRDTLETPSPSFSWLEVGYRGSATGGVWNKIDEITLDVDIAQLDISVPEIFNEFRIVGRNIKINSSSLDTLLINFNNDFDTSGNYGSTVTNGTSLYSSNKILTGTSMCSNNYNMLCDIEINNNVNDNITSIELNVVSSYAKRSNGIGVWKINQKINTIHLLNTSYQILTGSTFEIWGR